jgi:hypothetical protein
LIYKFEVRLDVDVIPPVVVTRVPLRYVAILLDCDGSGFTVSSNCQELESVIFSDPAIE